MVSVFVRKTCGKEMFVSIGNGVPKTLSQEDLASEETLIIIGQKLVFQMIQNATEKELTMLISGVTAPVKTSIWDASISTTKKWIEIVPEILPSNLIMACA